MSVGGRRICAEVAGLLQLDDHYRDPVAVQDEVKATMQVAVPDGHLIDRQPVVLVRIGADQTKRRGMVLPLIVDVGDPAIARRQPAVHPVVLRDGIVRRRCDDLDERLLQILVRDVRIQPAERVEHPTREMQILPALPLLRARRDVVSGRRRPAKLGEQLQRKDFPVALGHALGIRGLRRHDHAVSVEGSTSGPSASSTRALDGREGRGEPSGATW